MVRSRLPVDMKIKMSEARRECDGFAGLTSQVEAFAKIQWLITTVSDPYSFPLILNVFEPRAKDQTRMWHILLIHGIGRQ